MAKQKKSLSITGVDFSHGKEIIVQLSDESVRCFSLEQLLELKPIEVITAEDAAREEQA